METLRGRIRLRDIGGNNRRRCIYCNSEDLRPPVIISDLPTEHRETETYKVLFPYFETPCAIIGSLRHPLIIAKMPIIQKPNNSARMARYTR